MNPASLFKDFVEHQDPGQVSRHLREILLGFILQSLDTGLPLDFQTYLREFDHLFNLLDQADLEIRNHKGKSRASEPR